MNFLHSTILGIVEGLTEFLPISSTGHLILTSHFLGLNESAGVKAFEIVIQAGAIAAVAWEFRAPLTQKIRGAIAKNPEDQNFFLSILAAFIPTAILGLLFHKMIKEYLFTMTPVIAALIVGGVVMIVAERFMKPKTEKWEITPKKAVVVGIIQAIAMWPGTSRSMCSILGFRAMGANSKEAAEFSFYLALPTLGAAAAYDLLKSYRDLDGQWGQLLVGTLVSYVVALLVIRAFLKFLTKHGLAVFGIYRIILGIILIWVVNS